VSRQRSPGRPGASGRQRSLPRRIVIPLLNPRTGADLVRIGAALLEAGGVLIALSIVEVPAGVPLSDGATRARQARRLLQRTLEFAPPGTDLRTVVRIGRRAADGIVELAAEEEADLVLFGWGGRPSGRRTARQAVGRIPASDAAASDAVFSRTIDEVIREAPCDIAVVKQRGIATVRRILVPVRGGPHAEMALAIADRLGRSFGAAVDVLHVVPADIDATLRAQTERALAGFVRRHAGEHPRPLLVDGPNVTQAILHEASTADILVMGATAAAPPVGTGAGTAQAGAEAPLFGALPERIAQQAHPTVIVVRTRQTPDRSVFEERAARVGSLEAAERAARHAGESQRSVPARVDRWFGESSFHHAEFADIERLLELKARQGLTISAVLPTLNEAETIGPIVRAARAELMERFPLIDELLVIDSDSSDATRDIATAEGARVLRHPEVLPRYGSYRGKGEALWKSLHETSGELVVWSDTDIRDWHPRFLYGTLGPLLTEPRIGYVKAYYQRPIVEGGQLREGGGGRVTELVARPLINLFYPELSGMIQPLSGEYAGRREHLEQVAFFTGYAVEIGHLIDLSDKLGLNGLG
jgi:nucleotide-binding universal stress UspA family protein